MEEITSTWYCARTKPKHEHIAAASLSRQLGMDVFHPRLRMERATRRGPVRVIEPLFPGYIFARCTPEVQVDDICYAMGVKHLVRFGERIAMVPDAVIEELKQCFAPNEPMAVQDSLRPGAEVTVAAGAFEGSRGIVVRAVPAAQRVQILLDFLGRTTLTEVDRNSLLVEDSCWADLIPSLATPRTSTRSARAA